MIELAATEVHIWRLPLQYLSPPALATLSATLPQHEQRRLEPVSDFARRSALTQSRAGLRRVLARYLPVQVNDVEIQYDSGGRPILGGTASGDIHFNLSRSGAVALIGVCGESSIGIDVERIDNGLQWQAIAEHLFAPDEAGLLREMPPSRATEAFFKCWVSKEAYLKGLGLGLRAPTKDFSVCPDPDCPPAVRQPLKGATAGRGWTLQSLQVPAGYYAALASHGAARTLRYL